ncbi:MAG TPA: N-acetyltransferase, partial [Thermoprotei archaeon]|nr:N-acetyltransferase [Thermoprotei archaeon]
MVSQPEAQLVAEVEDKIAGFLRGKFDFEKEEAVIAHIAVHPRYQ